MFLNQKHEMRLFFYIFLGHATLKKALFVRRSIRWSIGPSVIIELKSVKTRIFNAAIVIVCVCEGVWMEVALAHPSSTIFNPRSLVFLSLFSLSQCLYLLSDIKSNFVMAFCQ